MEEYCTYCGSARGDRLSCCKEIHFMSAREYREYHGEWPADSDEGDPPTGPDYRLPEQYYADLAHEKRRRHMRGEDL